MALPNSAIIMKTLGGFVLIRLLGIITLLKQKYQSIPGLNEKLSKEASEEGERVMPTKKAEYAEVSARSSRSR